MKKQYCTTIHQAGGTLTETLTI